MKILVLNGPNLNLLGERDPHLYGSQSLAAIEDDLRRSFPQVDFTFLQSNHEGELIDALYGATREGAAGVVLNPGGYGHTSVALRDAVDALAVDVVEVHLSNIHGRESFRRRSLIAPVCKGAISGLGATGYELAVRFLLKHAA